MCCGFQNAKAISGCLNRILSRKPLLPALPTGQPCVMDTGLCHPDPFNEGLKALPTASPQLPSAASSKAQLFSGHPHPVPACQDNSEGPFQLQSSQEVIGSCHCITAQLLLLSSCSVPSLHRHHSLELFQMHIFHVGAQLRICFLETQPSVMSLSRKKDKLTSNALEGGGCGHYE